MQQQVKTIAELDREIEALYVKLRSRQVPGAMLELLNDDELYQLTLFAMNFVVAGSARGSQLVIDEFKRLSAEQREIDTLSYRNGFDGGYSDGYYAGFDAAVERDEQLRRRYSLRGRLIDTWRWLRSRLMSQHD